MSKLTAVTATSILGLLCVGCVSTSKYKKLMDEKMSLQSKVDMMAQDVEKLKVESESLKQSKAASESQYSVLMGRLADELQQGQLQIKQFENMLTVDVAEKIFFASGQANLKASGKKVLQKVGEALAQYQDKIIRVVGHTDNVPVSKTYQNIFPTNWELSVLRATNVVRFLQDNCKIAPENLIASGRGEFSPLVSNDTPENRQKNRRIEIILLDKNLAEAMSETPIDNK